MLLIKVDNSSCLLWLIVPHPSSCWRANTLRLLMGRRLKLFLVSRLLLLLTALVLDSKHSLLVEILRSLTRWRLVRSHVFLVWFLKVLVTLLMISVILMRHRDLNVCLFIDGVLIEFNRFLKLLLHTICFTDLINLILLNFFMVRDGCQLDKCIVWKVILLTVEFLKQGLG